MMNILTNRVENTKTMGHTLCSSTTNIPNISRTPTSLLIMCVLDSILKTLMASV